MVRHQPYLHKKVQALKNRPTLSSSIPCFTYFATAYIAALFCQAQHRFFTLAMKSQGRGSSLAAMNLRLLCLIHIQTILLLFIVLLHVKTFASFPGSIGTSSYSGDNETDHQALLAFKRKITHDLGNVLSSWNDSFHFCQWEGVT